MPKLTCPRFRNSLFLIMLCFAFRGSLVAQQYSIVASVLSPDNKPIEYGNIIALSAADSSLLTGAPFENGFAKLDGLSAYPVLVKITAIGYSDHLVSLTSPSHDSIINLGEIKLLINNSLDEVTIKAKIPLFEMDGEKVKVNVENTGLGSAGNALDVLRKSPGVMVNNSDNVSVFGKGTAIIYLDGLLISSVDILKSLPSNEIKSIEIIQNPSAKYDAAGRAVINIITIRNNLEGYNVNIIHNTLYIKSIFTYSGFRFNYTKQKWSVNISYGTNLGKQWTSDDYQRKYKVNDTTAVLMANSMYNTQDYSGVHYYRAGVNYRIDSLSTLGFQYNGFYNKRNDHSDNSNSVAQNNEIQYVLFTETKSKPVLLNNSFNGNYSRKFDTLGTELFVAAQYGAFNIHNISSIHQRTTVNGLNFFQEKRNTNRNDIQIMTAQANFSKAFHKNWKLESGLKESFITKASNIKFENYSSGQWISDPSYLNGFRFKENILAAYTELRYRKNKFNTRVGVRSELTRSDGFSKKLDSTIIDRQYINFFPSAFIGYDFTKDLTTSLTFSSRINRPTFQDLDPFIDYVDSLTSFRGNPYLLPEYTYSLEAALVYMKEANLTFGYNRTDGAMSLVVDKLNDGTDAFTAITKNLNQKETYSFGITIPYELKWWTTANYFGYFINDFSYQLNGVTVKNRQPTYTLYFYDEFRFKKWFSLEITYEYTSPAVDGVFVSRPFSMLNATLKKTFFDDKLTCRIAANDILRSYVMKGESNIPFYTIAYNSRVSTHFYLLALNYKFGKLKNNLYKNRSVSDEEYNRVKTGK
ncbi:MAG TPA: outer membrane beta-barrel family protein [Bacteroidia bacterium]